MASRTISDNAHTSKQFFSIQIENIILKEKVAHLNRLLEQQKSEYERTRALFEVKYNQQQYEYTNIINELQQKIEIQQNKFNKMERKLRNINQTVVNDHIEYENELKLLNAQMQFYITDSDKTRQSNIVQTQEINRLKQQVTHKDLDITNLQKELHTITYSYGPLLPHSNRSSITRLVKISPDVTPRSETEFLPEMSTSEFNTTYVKHKTNISKYRCTSKPLVIDVSMTKIESDEYFP
eukprot:725574_1